MLFGPVRNYQTIRIMDGNSTAKGFNVSYE